MSITLPPDVVDTEQPAWIHGELNGVASAPGLPEPVRALIARHTETFFAWRQAAAAARAAEADEERAKKVDAHHRSRALASGAAAPRAQTPAAAKAREDAQRHEADLRRALAMLESDIKAAIAASNGGWIDVIDAEDRRLVDDIRKLLDDVAAAFLRRAQLDRVRAQVAAPYAPKIWSAFDLSAPGVVVQPQVVNAIEQIRAYTRPADSDVFFIRTGAPSLHDRASD